MCERLEKWLSAIKNSVARSDLLSSTKCKNQLKKAVANPAVDFINMVLIPNLPEIAIQNSVKTARDHSISERIRAQIAANQEIDWGSYSFFTNPLTPVDRKHEYFRSPSARVSLGKHHIYTIEYDDVKNIPPSVQFGWCRSPGKSPSQSVMGKLHRDLSQKFADYFGITVVWSGNKSCHIHVVFRTHLIPTLPPNANLHEGFKRHWEKLRLIVSQHTGHGNPDPTCAAPSQYRRLPYGRHQNGNPQLVLWEQYRERAAKGVNTSFFEVEHFVESTVAHRIAQSRDGNAVGGDYNADEITHIEAQLSKIYSGYPRFVALKKDARGYKAIFKNSECDRSPSSYMRGDHRCVAIVGRDAATIHDVPLLPASLDQMMAVWIAEMHAADLGKCEATTYADARRMLRNYVADLAESEHRRVMIQAPEGAGKTTAIMTHHDKFAKGKASLYAFASYDIAEEKCSIFNEINKNGRYHGVVIYSWSLLYRHAAAELKLRSLTTTDAAESGYKSLLQMISDNQPEALKLVRGFCRETWMDIGDKVPVFFSVHDVAYHWGKFSTTRKMWSLARSAEVDENFLMSPEMDPMEISLLVHDEATIETFFSIIPKRAYQIAERMNVKSRNIRDCFLVYSAGVKLWSKDNKPSFDEMRRISWALSDYQPVRVSGRGSYPYLYRQINPKNQSGYLSLYSTDSPNSVGDWMIARRKWHVSDGGYIARRIIILTTEELPVACCPEDIDVFRFSTPCIPTDTVHVVLDRSVNSERIQEVVSNACTTISEATGSLLKIVSNCHGGVYTHLGVKGSDKLIGEDILQTCMFAAPCRHEILCALNDYLGRDDCVILDHIDSINQTCGRNLGFRSNGKSRNFLLVNRQLWNLIQSSPARAHLRYAANVVLDKNERKIAKRKSNEKRLPDSGFYDGSGYYAPIQCNYGSDTGE